MKLGDKHIIDGKEYVAVYTPVVSCEGCAFKIRNKALCETVISCETKEDNRIQESIWIEVKK